MPLRIRLGGLPNLKKKGLRVKILAWFFVPTAIILLAVALVNFYAYQDVTEDLVMERDQELTRLSADRLATELRDYTDLLDGVARAAASPAGDPATSRSVLSGARVQLAVFDGGLVMLDTFGAVVAVEPEKPGLLGQDWSNRSVFLQIVRFQKPVFSNIMAAEPFEPEAIAVAVPITGDQGQLLGVIMGMFRLNATAVSAFYGGIVKLRIGRSGSSYIVDGTGRVIYHSDAARVGADFSDQAAVRQAFRGQAGSIRARGFDGRDIIAGFARVPGTPWALVTEESWAALTSGGRGYQRYLLLLLALGVAAPALLVAVGLRQIMRPVEHLIGAAREVARGNFDQTITPGSKDEIGELAIEFNLMATQLRESYTQLEGKVAERTGELRVSEERYRALFEESRDAIFVSDPDGKVVATNRAALDLFGFTLEEAIGSDVGDRYVDASSRDQFRDVVAQTGSVRDFEVKLRKRDGSEIDCLMTATRRVDEDGRNLGIQGVIRDVTERVRAQAELLEQTREVAVLGERNRMAREIHDTMAQGFTGIVLQLEAGEQALGETAGEALGHLARAKALARECLQAARRSVWNLLPRALEQHPITDALEEEVRQFGSVKRERGLFDLSGDPRELTADVQTALLRICQQALTNVRSHAQATEVKVSLSFSPDAVHLQIRDDGVGFNAEAIRDGGSPGGFGLMGMEQRARLLGGDFKVISDKAKGTRVEVEIPTS